MKYLFTLLLVVAFVIPAQAQERTVGTQTITVESRPFWKKLLRGTARVLTAGVVQAAADTIKANQAFTFAFDHDGVDTDSYEIYVNTALNRSLPASMLVNGTVLTPFASGLPKGTYTFVVKAVGPGGEGVSDPFSLSVTAGNPSNPRNPRIIRDIK